MRTKSKNSSSSTTPFDFHMTQAKYKRLEDELEKSIASRPALIEEMRLYAVDGDFSENDAYQTAKRRLRGLNNRIDRIKTMLVHAEIINGDEDISKVRLGHFVKLKIGSKINTYQILGSMETNPSKNIISHNSPIGAAIMGHRAGDVVEVKLNDRIIECEIMEIGTK